MFLLLALSIPVIRLLILWFFAAEIIAVIKMLGVLLFSRQHKEIDYNLEDSFNVYGGLIDDQNV
jgi:hypothetical protein